uniref:Uncharacterized protein n=1 Tax=Rhizochromulina marina TaxID=1034831 RepID=A0A7S2W6P1_9STRA
MDQCHLTLLRAAFDSVAHDLDGAMSLSALDPLLRKLHSTAQDLNTATDESHDGSAAGEDRRDTRPTQRGGGGQSGTFDETWVWDAAQDLREAQPKAQNEADEDVRISFRTLEQWFQVFQATVKEFSGILNYQDQAPQAGAGGGSA